MRNLRPRAAPGREAETHDTLQAYWAIDSAELLRRLRSTSSGLTSSEAADRLQAFGPNELSSSRPLSRALVLAAQLRSPLVLLLLFAAAISGAAGEWRDAVLVLGIVLATAAVGYSREYSAAAATAALGARLRTLARVLRDGEPVLVPVDRVVPGDVILLSAGSLVPGDSVVLEAVDCFVSEAVLTGESFPAQKRSDTSAAAAPLSKRSNVAFLGTNVRSGFARCVVVRTGRATEFGHIAERLRLRPPETEFDRGLRRFGYLLTSAMLSMVLTVFAAHVLQGRPPVETLLFSVALAVGLSPELLPAVLTINLARAAQRMASVGVLVRRLNSIENLGSMDVLCTDKTGTLTEGVVALDGAYDGAGAPSSDVLELGALNAAFESGLANPLDEAILRAHAPKLEGLEKVAEIPFDFVRKRLSVVVRYRGALRLVTKGAYRQVVDVCTHSAGGEPLAADRLRALDDLHESFSARGVRVLAVAVRDLEPFAVPRREDETGLRFMGFLTFVDRPKAGAAEALHELSRLGVDVKLVTGDSRLVAEHLASVLGMRHERVLTGADLARLNDEALWRDAERTDLFVEVDPNQKERIILALKKMGHVVGFLGDGVNDAPAMHAADTSISVDGAADVAREAADFVLMERHLDVIRRGIEAGRKTFANTLKYVLTTTSANLGNMVSMAAASLFLPFLPLLAGQILLNNFLSDIPAFGIAGDRVDAEMVDRPRRWDMRFIARFMLEFGLLSSAFDLLTFAMLLAVFRASETQFRSAWFVESLLTELVIALAVRSRRPFFRSRPGAVLLWTTVVLVPLTLAIPYLPFAGALGFEPLPAGLLVALATITVLYVCAVELLKAHFYRR